jgi:hypothetical protein
VQQEGLHAGLLALLGGLELCEQGVRRLAEGFRAIARGARLATSLAGAAISTRPRTRRVPVRVPASPTVAFSDVDRQRARVALARANLVVVKRTP